MIVGNGLIASRFKEFDAENIIFFASGVSNSSETNESEFERERTLLVNTLNNHKEKKIVYFSTCSIYDSSKYNSPYVLHKLHMEDIIQINASQYLILRVSNAVGRGGNPNLLMNYIYAKILNQNELIIHKYATRNLIDVDDLVKLTYHLLEKNNQIYNIAFHDNFEISQVVDFFEKELNIKAYKRIIDFGENYSIDINPIKFYFKDISKDDYLKGLILKYYK